MVVLSLDNGGSCLLTVIFWLLYALNTPERIPGTLKGCRACLDRTKPPEVADLSPLRFRLPRVSTSLLFISKGARGGICINVLSSSSSALHPICLAVLHRFSSLRSTCDSLCPLLARSLDIMIASSSTTGLQNNNLPSSARKQMSKHSSVLFYMPDKLILMKWTCISHDNLH